MLKLQGSWSLSKFSIFQTKYLVSWKQQSFVYSFVWYFALLNYYYSQTCSNDHLYKTNTRLRPSMLTLPKLIPIKSILHKTTTCLTQSATSFFVPQMKKTCLKQPQQNFFQWRNGKQCTKNKRLSYYIYLITTL